MAQQALRGKVVKTPTQYEHSVPVPLESFEGLEYFSLFQPRIHRNAIYADEGSWQCQVDFLDATAAARADAKRNERKWSYAVGSINPRCGNFTALCACDAEPERLALISYIVEYAFIHDDVIEYAEDKDESRLWETNRDLTDGLNPEGNFKSGTKDQVRNRQLQAKMAVELVNMDREMGKECLHLWKTMTDTFVQIRGLDFQLMDDYLRYRVIDAGCPWTLSLLCFAMKFQMTKEEREMTDLISAAAFNSMVLVNDYFSWEKEWEEYQNNGCRGEIVSACFLFMKWYSVSQAEAKKMLKAEIKSRELKYCELKAAHLALGDVPERTVRWLGLLDCVIAGNFVWSMTTPRYIAGVDDSYPDLRAARREGRTTGATDDYIAPIAPRSGLTTLSFEKSHGGAQSADSLAPLEESTKEVQDRTDVQPPNGNSTGSLEQSSRLSRLMSAYGDIVTEPYSYIDSLPSKGVRNSVIDALETWYQVPERPLEIIRTIINMLHSYSLMVDDIEDGSVLRRGFPATHTVFGIAQTINAANMFLVKTMKFAESLSATAVSILTEKLLQAHIGQAMDLRWTHQSIIPTVEEYLDMVDCKTGVLFQLAAELMRSEATANKDLDLTELLKQFGRFFQVRDDYQNLVSAEYTTQKGRHEDISEGKASLPLILTLQKSPKRGLLLSILQQRKFERGLSIELRELVLEQIRSSDGLAYTRCEARRLQAEVERQLAALERKTGMKNWILKLVKHRLEI